MPMTLFDKLFQKGLITEGGMLFIIIILLYWITKNIFFPIKKQLNDMPNKTEVENVVQEACEDLNLDEIRHKLEKLEESLNDLMDIDRDSNKEINQFKRDLETMKQLLNQFHGHLIYNVERRAANFGNKELI